MTKKDKNETNKKQKIRFTKKRQKMRQKRNKKRQKMRQKIRFTKKRQKQTIKDKNMR